MTLLQLTVYSLVWIDWPRVRTGHVSTGPVVRSPAETSVLHQPTLPACVFAEGVAIFGRLTVSPQLLFLLVDRVLLAAAPLDDADQGDDEQQERDDAHHADKPAGWRLQRLSRHYTHAHRISRAPTDQHSSCDWAKCRQVFNLLNLHNQQ